MMGWWHYGGWWAGLGIILMIIFWGLIIWLIVWAIRRSGAGSGPGSGQVQQTPLDIAKTRYARGEITKEQFEQIKKDLS